MRINSKKKIKFKEAGTLKKRIEQVHSWHASIDEADPSLRETVGAWSLPLSYDDVRMIHKSASKKHITPADKFWETAKYLLYRTANMPEDLIAPASACAWFVLICMVDYEEKGVEIPPLQRHGYAKGITRQKLRSEPKPPSQPKVERYE